MDNISHLFSREGGQGLKGIDKESHIQGLFHDLLACLAGGDHPRLPADHKKKPMTGFCDILDAFNETIKLHEVSSATVHDIGSTDVMMAPTSSPVHISGTGSNEALKTSTEAERKKEEEGMLKRLRHLMNLKTTSSAFQATSRSGFESGTNKFSPTSKNHSQSSSYSPSIPNSPAVAASSSACASTPSAAIVMAAIAKSRQLAQQQTTMNEDKSAKEIKKEAGARLSPRGTKSEPNYHHDHDDDDEAEDISENYEDAFDYDGENPILAMIQSDAKENVEVGPPLSANTAQATLSVLRSAASRPPSSNSKRLDNYADELKQIEEILKQNNINSSTVFTAEYPKKSVISAGNIIGHGILPSFPPGSIGAMIAKDPGSALEEIYEQECVKPTSTLTPEHRVSSYESCMSVIGNHEKQHQQRQREKSPVSPKTQSPLQPSLHTYPCLSTTGTSTRSFMDALDFDLKPLNNQEFIAALDAAIREEEARRDEAERKMNRNNSNSNSSTGNRSPRNPSASTVKFSNEDQINGNDEVSVSATYYSASDDNIEDSELSSVHQKYHDARTDLVSSKQYHNPQKQPQQQNKQKQKQQQQKRRKRRSKPLLQRKNSRGTDGGDEGDGGDHEYPSGGDDRTWTWTSASPSDYDDAVCQAYDLN